MKAISHTIPTNEVQRFMLAGNATLTFQSNKTSKHFTYKIEKAEDKDLWYVRVLNGSDNVSSYLYLGCLYMAKGKVCFKLPANPRIGEDASSYLVFKWAVDQLPLWQNFTGVSQMSIRHEGYCCKCGRVLTTPDSIVSGIGPVCAGNMRKEEAKKLAARPSLFAAQQYNAGWQARANQKVGYHKIAG